MKYVVVAFALLFKMAAFALPPTLAGMVRDAETKEPLPYTHIVYTGTSKGTTADSSGRFLLDLAPSQDNDTLLFSYLGYETLKIRANELSQNAIVYLRPTALHLAEVQVLSKSLTAEQIVERVEQFYEKNYPTLPVKQNIFFHKYERVPFQKENQLIVKKTDFVGLDKKTFEELYQKIPSEFLACQDALVELWSDGDDYKLVPQQAVSMEEGSQQALMKEFETKLGTFMEDIEKSSANKDIYYKFRTGILGFKVNPNEQSEALWEANKTDTMHYTVSTEQVKNELLALVRNYASLEGKNWEFITDRNKYNYILEDVVVSQGEVAFRISFSPRKQGLFQGSFTVSTTTYALLQLDYAFAAGKQTEKIKLFGISHAMNFKEGHVTFQKGPQGYSVKYMSAKQQESGGVDRDFVVKKKQKRFLVDKELNEIKLEVQLFFDTYGFWELLVLDTHDIDPSQFEKTKEPYSMKYKKAYAKKPSDWEKRTSIAPSLELDKFKNK